MAQEPENYFQKGYALATTGGQTPDTDSMSENQIQQYREGRQQGTKDLQSSPTSYNIK